MSASALQRVPETAERGAWFASERTMTDHEAAIGLNVYYVRVAQTDGEMAWFSPIYVHYQPGGHHG